MATVFFSLLQHSSQLSGRSVKLTNSHAKPLPPKSVAEEIVSSRHHAGGEAICVPRAARRSVAAFACACGRPSV